MQTPLQQRLSKLANDELLVIPREEAQEMLERLEVVRTVDTTLAGSIHLVRLPEGGAAIVEYPPRTGQCVLRPVPSLQAGRELIAERLDIYERMWDGCGCKVDYFAPVEAK